MATKIHTSWSLAQMEQTELTEEQKHLMFADYARVVANSYAPWLFPLLDAAGATVFTSPGKFLIFLDSDSVKFHEIPELSALISVTPWPESQNTAQ